MWENILKNALILKSSFPCHGAQYVSYLFICFVFSKRKCLKRETAWKRRDTLLPFEPLKMLLGEKLPEHRGTHAGEPSKGSICGTVQAAGRNRDRQPDRSVMCQRHFCWCIEGTVESAKNHKATESGLNQA